MPCPFSVKEGENNMSEEICVINVRNKTLSSVVIGNSVLPPRTVKSGFSAVKLFTEDHIRGTYFSEMRGIIEVAPCIPEEVLKETNFYKKIELKNNDVKQVEVASKEEAVNEEKVNEAPVTNPVNETPEVEPVNQTLTEDDINGMTAKALKEYIATTGIDIEGYSRMSAKELKSAVSAHFGYSVITE